MQNPFLFNNIKDGTLLPQVIPGGTGTCGEGEDVVGVHTLLSGAVQVCHELLVGEEEEKEGEQGRQGEKKVKRRSKRREHTHVDDHVDGMKRETQNLEPWCMCMDEIKMTI